MIIKLTELYGDKEKARYIDSGQVTNLVPNELGTEVQTLGNGFVVKESIREICQKSIDGYIEEHQNKLKEVQSDKRSDNTSQSREARSEPVASTKPRRSGAHGAKRKASSKAKRQ